MFMVISFVAPPLLTNNLNSYANLRARQKTPSIDPRSICDIKVISSAQQPLSRREDSVGQESQRFIVTLSEV